MRILVIGRSGQVATSLVERAATASVEVIAVGRPEVDLTQKTSVEAALNAHQPDVVINAAAYTAVDAAETDEAAAFALNAEGPTVLSLLCRAKTLPLIHISTDYVFDGTLDRPYREDDPTNPKSAYGRSKRAGEKGVIASGANALIVRTAWVYSPFGKNFVKTMLRLGAERTELKVVADQVGNPTSALDIADTLLALAPQHKSWPQTPTIAHMTAAGDTSWHGFAEAIFANAGLSPVVHAIKTEEFPTPAERPRNSRLDCAFLNTRFRLTLPHWRDSLTQCVARLTTP